MSGEELLSIYDGKRPYKIAWEELAQITDIEEQCHRSGARYDPGSRRIFINFLNRMHVVSLSDRDIFLKDSEEEVPRREKTLILHYLTLAKGTPLTGKLITYKQVPGGLAYFPRFSQLAVQPLLSHFGERPELLIPAAQKLGGERIERGDAAVVLRPFSRVSITIVLQRGDEEFPPAASLLFDSSITDYLPSQDIRIGCEILAWRLIRFSTNVTSSPQRSF